MVARLAKVSVEDLATISSPDEVSIDASVAQRVLAVTFHPSDDRQWTPGVGAQRRIRALVAMGFPFDDLAQRVGVSSDVLESLPARGLIHVALWTSIDRSLRRAFDDAGRSRPCRPRLGPRRSKLVASVGGGTTMRSTTTEPAHIAPGGARSSIRLPSNVDCPANVQFRSPKPTRRRS